MQTGRHTSDGSSNSSPERDHKVTIRDVARRAGVSPSTVSRAFSKPDRVSAGTAKRIFAVADEMGYHSQTVETMPVRCSKGVIAIIVPDLANQFFSDMIHAVELECQSENLGVVISESIEDAGRERDTFNCFVPFVDGVIIASSRMPDSMIRKCAQTRPVVVTNRVVRGVGGVIMDVSKSVMQLVEHITGLGFDRITYIDGPASSWSASTRWNAFNQACSARHVACRRLWPGIPTYEGGSSFVRRYLADPTGAVVAHNDMMAAGFIAAMRREGYHCPDDFVIAGFDNDAISQITQPTLTTVRQPSSLMGARAARQLIRRIGGECFDPQPISIPTSLVVRDSTRPGEASAGAVRV